MDITTIYKVIVCIGILQRCSLYHVDADDGILFEVPEMVEWSQAEPTCQKNNGKLFKPNKTSFDVSLFKEYNFNDDLWVAATYINVFSFESASMQSDSVIRCEMCTIGERCETTCLYQACGNRCRAVCKYLFEPHNLVLSDITNNWTETKQWCSEHLSEISDKIQNASSLFALGYCDDICLWTRNVIQVSFQTTLAPMNMQGECGVLHNGTLAFTSCSTRLHPLCERVDAVDGILFQGPEMVEWSQAEQSCQKNNGKLFKPKETSFDVSLFSEWNCNDELWVAATYINIVKFESASMQPDSVIRCEICTIGDRCETTCLYQACGKRCRAVCKYIIEPYNLVLSDSLYYWSEAMQWCSKHMSEFGDKIQNASHLFSQGYCLAGCIWTRNLIQVQLNTETAPISGQGECGILHNGTLAFTSCSTRLHPLCERVVKTAFETPRLSYSEGNNSCNLSNNTITYMVTTESSRKTNLINATLITSSTNGTSTVASENTKRTTIVLNENSSSLLVPVVAIAARNDLEDTPHKSNTGIIIGAVTGSFILLMMTFIGIVCIRRRLLQRIRGKKSKHDGKNTKMPNTDTIDPSQCDDVPLETGSGFTVIAQLESNREGSHTSMFETISDHRKPASFLDPEGNQFNYETLTRNINANSSNPNSNIDYDGYEHLNSVHKRRDDILKGNIYDTVQYE